MKYGKQVGLRGNFGACHIWAEHDDDVLGRNYEGTEDQWLELTARYVADIIQSGAKILCESIGSKKATILKSPIGMAIIENRQDAQNNDYYVVITAFKKKNPHGVVIGNLA